MDQSPKFEEISKQDVIPELQGDVDIQLSDFFYLYQYKIQACPKTYSHDWTQCVYAHPTENARRRDPRISSYSPTPCPNYKRGVCLKGDGCQYSHGVFERWLHPSMFKTRICAEGQRCQRKCCFFAHSQDELREPATVNSSEFQDSPNHQEQKGVGIQAPRMSNSLIRSLGLNPKDHAMVNVQKLLRAFQNRDQVQQFQSIKNKPSLQEEILGKQIVNTDKGLNQQYAYGLDSSMVNFMGQQFGFNEEQLNNLQRQFLQIKENNTFNQVLQNSSTPSKGQSLPFSPPSLEDSQSINFPFGNENLVLSPHTRNTENGLEDIFAQLCMQQQQNSNSMEVPQQLSQCPSQRFIAQLQHSQLSHQNSQHNLNLSQQLSHQNSMHNQHLSHQNSQISQRLLAQVQHQNNIKEQQLSHQSSFQDQQLYQCSARQNNGLQVFNPENSGNIPFPFQNFQDPSQLQPNLMYDFLDTSNDFIAPANQDAFINGDINNQGLNNLQLKQHMMQFVPQLQDQQLNLFNQKLSNNILSQQATNYAEVLEGSKNGSQIFDNQLQLKPAISVSKFAQ